MFAKAIREERRNLNIQMFARAIDSSPKSVEAWENGRLPQTRVFNRLAREFGWSHKKASKIADWIEDERERRRNESHHEKLKVYAFDQISNIVLHGSGSLSDIDLIVNDTLEVIAEEVNG